jgi:hypothetical protein
MTHDHDRRPRPGDAIEIRGIPGADARHGTIEEILGEAEHRHYRVRWDDGHESIVFPGSGEGVHIHPRRRHRREARA